MNKLALLAAMAGMMASGPIRAQEAPKAEWIRAEVIAVDATRARVTLKHEAFQAATVDMGAMTMGFKASNGSLLKAVKVGDKVRFTVTVKDDEVVVTQIEAAP